MPAPPKSNETDNADSAVTGFRFFGGKAFFRQHLSRFQWTAKKTWWLLAVGMLLLLLMTWGFSPSPPQLPAPVRPPQPALLKTHHYWAIGTALLLMAAVGMSLHIGTLMLSGQTLAHRRNVLLGGVLLVLAELFNVDALKALSVDPNKVPLKMDGTAFLKEEIVFGVLALFIVFSYIEYLYNFIADYIKARMEFQKIQKENRLALISFRGVSQLFVGVGRIVFDVVLPVTVFCFAVLLYQREAWAVVDVVHGFLETKFETIRQENPRINEYFEKAVEAVSTAQDGVQRTIEDVKNLPTPP